LCLASRTKFDDTMHHDDGFVHTKESDEIQSKIDADKAALEKFHARLHGNPLSALFSKPLADQEANLRKELKELKEKEIKQEAERRKKWAEEDERESKDDQEANARFQKERSEQHVRHEADELKEKQDAERKKAEEMKKLAEEAKRQAEQQVEQAKKDAEAEKKNRRSCA